ncbi:ATP-binding protein [Candidatus Poribacteria bacterium]
MSNNMHDLKTLSHISDPEIRDILRGIRSKMDDPEVKEAYKRQREKEGRARVEQLLGNSDIPKIYQDKTFDNFIVSPQNRKALEACREYVRNFEPGTRMGLAIFGDVGVGKSHLAVAVVKEIILQRGIAAKYADVLCTLEMIRSTFDGSEQNPIQTLVKYPFLVLDDLGSERPTRWTLEQITYIVKYRLQEGLPLMITTNAKNWRGVSDMLTSEIRGGRAPKADLAVSVARLIDRLQEHVGDPLVIIGKSWRGCH